MFPNPEREKNSQIAFAFLTEILHIKNTFDLGNLISQYSKEIRLRAAGFAMDLNSQFPWNKAEKPIEPVGKSEKIINPIVFDVLNKYFNAELTLRHYINNEKIMSEFVFWLENLSSDMLDKIKSDIPIHIHELLSSLCHLRNEKGFDIIKTMVKIYIQNEKIESLETLLKRIFQANWFAMLYNLFTYFYNEKLFFPLLKDAIEKMWFEKISSTSAEDHAALFTQIELWFQQKQKNLDNLPILIVFLKILHINDRFHLDYLIADCNQIIAMEASIKSLAIDLLQKKIQHNAEFPISNEQKKEFILSEEDIWEENISEEDFSDDEKTFPKKDLKDEDKKIEAEILEKSKTDM